MEDNVMSDVKSRQVYYYGNVDESRTQKVIKKLKKLEKDNPTKDIDLFVSSWGGNVHDFLAIYDIIRTLRCTVNTFSVGKSASAGAMMLMVGTGHRVAYKNSDIMIHELSAGNMGSLTDMDVYHDHLKESQKRLNRIISEHTDMSIEKVEEITKRDKWLTADQALELGIVDEVI